MGEGNYISVWYRKGWGRGTIYRSGIEKDRGETMQFEPSNKCIVFILHKPYCKHNKQDAVDPMQYKSIQIYKALPLIIRNILRAISAGLHP